MFEGITKFFSSSDKVNLDTSEFVSRINRDDDAIIIDVRTRDEYASGHIDGAMNLDALSRNFLIEMIELDTSKSYYLYCRTGGRSENACVTLISAGFNQVYNLRGGLQRSGRKLKLVS